MKTFSESSVARLLRVVLISLIFGLLNGSAFGQSSNIEWMRGTGWPIDMCMTSDNHVVVVTHDNLIIEFRLSDLQIVKTIRYSVAGESPVSVDVEGTSRGGRGGIIAVSTNLNLRLIRLDTGQTVWTYPYSSLGLTQAYGFGKVRFSPSGTSLAVVVPGYNKLYIFGASSTGLFGTLTASLQLNTPKFGWIPTNYGVTDLIVVGNISGNQEVFDANGNIYDNYTVPTIDSPGGSIPMDGGLYAGQFNFWPGFGTGLFDGIEQIAGIAANLGPYQWPAYPIAAGSTSPVYTQIKASARNATNQTAGQWAAFVQGDDPKNHPVIHSFDITNSVVNGFTLPGYPLDSPYADGFGYSTPFAPSSDWQKIVVASADKPFGSGWSFELGSYDLNGNPLAMSNGHSLPVSFLKYSPDGSLIATASVDQSVRIWRSSRNSTGAPGTLVTTLQPFSGISSIAFSPNGKFFAICGPTGLSNTIDLSVYSMANPVKPVLVFSDSGNSLVCAFTKDSQYLDTMSSTFGTFTQYRISDWSKVPGLTTSLGGSTFDTTSNPNQVVLGFGIYDLKLSKQVVHFNGGPDGMQYARTVKVSPNGKSVVLVDGLYQQAIAICDMTTGKLITSYGPNTAWLSADWSFDSQYIYAVNQMDGIIHVIDANTGIQLQTYAKETGTDSPGGSQDWGAQCIAVAPNGSSFAYGRGDSVLVEAATDDFFESITAPQTAICGTIVTGLISLLGPAPAGGMQVSLTSSNPKLATVPAIVTVPAGATRATFSISTAPKSTSYSATITGTVGTLSHSATISVTGDATQSVSANPNPVVGGSNSTGQITLLSAAPAGGWPVKLASSSVNCVVPASVTVAAGAKTTNFSIKTTAATGGYTLTLTASDSVATKTVVLSVLGNSIASLSLSPATVKGGASSKGTITLTTTAPVSGWKLNLLSQSPSAVRVPASVTIPAGQKTATFTISTYLTTTGFTCSITASDVLSQKSATLNVNP